MKKIFKLFAHCRPVKGAKRYVICDIQRNDIYFISEGLYEILTEYKHHSLEEIRDVYHQEYDEVIGEYFKFLEENELGFWCENPDNFPDIDFTWETPEWISNCIIECNRDTEFDFENIFEQLHELGCKQLEIRFYDPIHFSALEAILERTNGSHLRNINIYIAYGEDLMDQDLDMLLLRYQRIGYLFITATPVDYQVSTSNQRIQFINEVIKDNTCCGQVHASYFRINQAMFTESLHYNSCLHKKISITPTGEVKNCPSLPLTFGNVKQQTLKEIVIRDSFKEYWQITKDQIDICKDCEFRYVCTDCRAFIENPKNIYAKPLKCNYDPYTATWV